MFKQGTISVSPLQASGDIESQHSVSEIWPSRRPAAAPPYTPEAVARRFIQGENAFDRHDWHAAVAMYRSALDIGTKALPGVPQGTTFFKRLEWLHINHHITPEIRAWGDHVRVDGNESLHDTDEFDEADVAPLRLFTEMFLRYVFELPGAVAAFRAPPTPLSP